MKINFSEDYKNFLPLLYSNCRLFIASGFSLRKLNLTDPVGETSFPSPPVSLAAKWAADLRLLRRAGKLTFRELAPGPGGELIAVVGKGLYILRDGDDRFEEVLRVKDGGRPKGTCVAPSGNMFVGEYGMNKDRRRMRIWGAGPKGRDWQVVYTFPAGSIRHIHNLVWDENRNGIWVLTGDRENECSISFTGDEFKTLDEVVKGGQEYRACNLFCEPDAVYYATDSETSQNWFVSLNPETGETNKIQKLPGSSIYANRMAGMYFVSTCVEPSKVNKTPWSTLWCSKDLVEWEEFTRFKKDMWPGEYFGFGNIVLPRIEGECPYIIYSATCVKSFDNTAFIYK